MYGQIAHLSLKSTLYADHPSKLGFATLGPIHESY